MAHYDWSTFTRRITINADVKTIYVAWATSNALEKWFLRSAKFKTADGKIRHPNHLVKMKDTYAWTWHGHSDKIVERGKVLKANGKDNFKFVFGKAGIVSVSIFKEKGETICEIVQSEIPTDEKSKVDFHVGCSVGWTFYLANLKSFLECGTDLRNRNEKIKNVVSS